jgi:hypothetical protein
MTTRETYRQTISRVMSQARIGASREVLTILINQVQPQGMTLEERGWWGEEKQNGLDDWERELETDGSVTCSGGSLVQGPISSAAPESLASEKFTQLPLL